MEDVLKKYKRHVKMTKKDIKAFEQIEKQIEQLKQMKDANNIESIYEENRKYAGKADNIWEKNDYVHNTMTKMLEESIKSGEAILSTSVDDLIKIKELERVGLIYKINKDVQLIEGIRKDLPMADNWKVQQIEDWKKLNFDDVKNKSYQLKDVKNKGLVGKVRESRDKYKLIKNITKMEYQRARGKSLEKINQLSDGTKLTPRQRRRIVLLYKILHSSIPVATFNGVYRGLRKSNKNLKTYNRIRKNSKEYNKRVNRVERRRSEEMER